MENLNRIHKIFENIRELLKNKNSPDWLQNLKKDIQNINTELVVLGKENHDEFVRSLTMEGYLALLSVKTMPISLTEKKNILFATYNKLKQYALRDECLFIFLRIQNLLCYYLIHLDHITLARDILENTEDIYDQVGKTKCNKYLDAEDLFTIEPLNKLKRIDPEKIDKVITNNVQMQAFLYNKMNLPQKYFLYNHMALRRQLEMKEGTPNDWALKTARLGSDFTHVNKLGNARYHLCAAYYVLRTCHDNCKLIPEEFVLQKTDFEIQFLELSHHWVKYGLTIFKLSKKKVLNRYFSQPSSRSDLWKTFDVLGQCFKNVERIEENLKDLSAEKIGKGDCVQEKILTFPTLNLKEMEKRIPLETVCEIEGARKLFAFTRKWLMRAKNYYDFEHNSAQYVSCSLQLAELYEHLAFFEKNIDNEYNIQKRRADVLEALNCLLRTCDSAMSAQIDVIKELSQVQLELMALNLQKLWSEESQANLFRIDSDTDSIMNTFETDSNKTLTEKTLNTTSKNIFLRKMEAATSLNGKLYRLSEQLSAKTPSLLSLEFSKDLLTN